jgi:SAM-dependent methyltransferase
MSASDDDIRAVLEPFGPTLPFAQLVQAVNALYHAAEAPQYDGTHAEVFEQLPPIWSEGLHWLQQRRETSEWRVIDFGCGTGFEARQLLAHVPPAQVASLTCYDPSPEMLAVCRRNLHSLYPAARFTGSLDEVIASSQTCNLVLSNSVLHHLPDPVQTMVALGVHAAPDAVWIAGHEPSRRFYQNVRCVDTYTRYLRFRRWHRFLVARNYWRAAQRLLRRRAWPAAAAAEAAYQMGYFTRPPRPDAIDRLVDLHVAASREEAERGRGFDIDMLRHELAPTWRLLWSKTYSFLGPFYEGRAPSAWRSVCQTLAEQYPLDGATFMSMWVRGQ